MSAVENKKLIEDAFGMWVRGDRAAFNNLLADDLHWTVIGNSPVSGRYNSKREFLEGASARMSEKLATPIKPTLRHVIADGDMVALVFNGDATARTIQSTTKPTAGSCVWRAARFAKGRLMWIPN